MTERIKKAISGLGPHGERAARPDRLALSEEDVRAASQRGFSVAIVMHTLSGDWSQQSIAGIVSTLGQCGAVVSEIVDCGFDASKQIAALERLSGEPIDAVVSIPVSNAAVAEAHRQVEKSDKRLILHDNVPTGFLPGRDYTSLVSADNFGLGLIAAELLAEHVGEGQEIGLLAYGVDFFATNEREIAFGRWIKANRPDLTVRVRRFASLETTGPTTEALITEFPGLAGLFAVWDIPAIKAISALDRLDVHIPLSTVDLGVDIAIDLAQAGPTVGIAAQQPYAQGVAVAQTAVLSLLGLPVPSWTALPGLPVTAENVAESFQRVWSRAAPPQILARERGKRIAR